MMYRPSMMRQALRPGLLVTLVVLALSACGGDQQSEQGCEAPAEKSASTDPDNLWDDATKSTIGATKEWTNKVELADIDGDGLVDILFANGGDYDYPGEPTFSQVFLNRGSDQMFEEATRQVFPNAMLARVIKVRDVNADGSPDILVGTTFQTQSHLYLGDSEGNFTDVTKTHLPQIKASVGDLEFGDVDSDGDLDVVLADWGKGSPMLSDGGRTMLWLNDGTGHFTDATQARMPDALVQFSWELEFVDVDNDYDLDILISCKVCGGSYLFENDGTGTFTDVTRGRLPQFPNNYDFEAMDVNGDDYLDVVTINDGIGDREQIFINDRQGGFTNETSRLWPESENVGYDDNVARFLDFDSDGDADVLIGSLTDPDRLHLNDGSGMLKLVNPVEPMIGNTFGTLDIALADLDSDCRLDVVQAQGETATSFKEKVHLGNKIQPDTAEPVITQVEKISAPGGDQPVPIRARVHDNKSPTMPHDWRKVVLRWSADGRTHRTPMQWYGEYLWSAKIDNPPDEELSYEVCATDAAGNKACASP
jgi:hypothetical protein